MSMSQLFVIPAKAGTQACNSGRADDGNAFARLYLSTDNQLISAHMGPRLRGGDDVGGARSI